MISWTLHYPDGWVVPLEAGALLTLEEAKEYEISCEGVSAFECFFDGVKIEPSAKGSLTIRPNWVANSELRLVGADQSAICPVRVQPNQEKLSDALWIAMVSDLENWLSGISVGLEGGRAGSVGAEGVSLPFITEALTPLLASFERSLQALLEQPRQRDVSTQEDVPLRMVRRVDRETLHWVSKHPHVQDQLDPWRSLELCGAPALIPQRWTVETNDHPANRYISWLVRRVEATLRLAEAGLLNASSRRNITEDGLLWCQSRADNLRDGANRVNKTWKRSFLSGVQREPLSEAALQVILDDPIYLRVHQIGRLFLNPLFQFDVSGGEHQAAVRPSYSIYEIWAFLAVSQQLKGFLPGWTWQTCSIKSLLNPCASGEGALYQAKNSTGESFRFCSMPPLAVSLTNPGGHAGPSLGSVVPILWSATSQAPGRGDGFAWMRSIESVGKI